MRKFIFLFSFLMLMACGSVNSLLTIGKNGLMLLKMNGYYTSLQFDSMCLADTLPTDLMKWDSILLKDHETSSKTVLHYLHVDKDSTEVLYKVEITDYSDSIKITKREIVKQ